MTNEPERVDYAPWDPLVWPSIQQARRGGVLDAENSIHFKVNGHGFSIRRYARMAEWAVFVEVTYNGVSIWDAEPTPEIIVFWSKLEAEIQKNEAAQNGATRSRGLTALAAAAANNKHLSSLQ